MARERSGFRSWFSPPAFESEAATLRARMLHRTVWWGMAVVTVGLLALALAEPAAADRALLSLAAVDLLGLSAHALSRRGHPRAGSMLIVGGLIAFTTLMALSGGGIRSAGITIHFAFVMLAGLLLGPNGARQAALVCAVAGAALVISELAGVIDPTPTAYGPTALLVIYLLLLTVVVMLTDVGTRSVRAALRRAEAELAEREEAERRLGMALEGAGIGMWESVQGSGRYHFDERTFEIYDLQPTPDGTVTLEQVRARVHPDDAATVGSLSRLGETETGTHHHRLLRPDGTVRHVSVTGRVIPATAREPARIVGMAIDVTERTQAELEQKRLVWALRERVKELTLLQHVARLLHSRWFFDRSVLREIVMLMPAGWQYAEHCEARIRFRDDVYATPGWRETPWHLAQSFETSTGSGVVEVVYTREFPDEVEGPFLAEERALLVSIAEMLVGHLEGEHIEQLRRGLEAELRQSQKMEALGTLAGGIAHDFNNILTAIGGNVDLALAETRDASVTAYLQELRKAHQRARDLVQRILVFSRRQETQKKVIHVERVAEEALLLLRPSVDPKIRFEQHFEPDLPAVLADSSQIHQVLMNLATNAVHAMREKGGVLDVALEARTIEPEAAQEVPGELPPGRYVCLTVSDTGTGIDAQVVQRMFEPFYTTKGVQGTGLGLSVVHGIVHQHGGAIQVESEPGVGTIFEIYFPAATEPAAASAAPDAAQPGGRGQRILCVDDEEAVLFVLTRTLERMGYVPIGFSSPADALRAFREDPDAYDGVLSDMGMPGMSGLELAKLMRTIRPAVPIAIVSGYGQPPDAATQVSTWIHKPPTRDELARALEEMLAAVDPAPSP